MAASPTASTPFDRAMDAFARTAPALPLAVAFSGGADSTALLLACAQRWPGQVEAWHVHHGLQAAADDFERHCVQWCAHQGIPLKVRRVDARHAPGDSPEAAARAARYAALDALAHDRPDAPRTVLLAQHADDQLETVLLALSRGAGLPGLAAMPARWRRGAVSYRRPLLDVPGPALREWLRARGQTWAEDPSNASERFTRNLIRRQLLPTLLDCFPQARATFARSAAHAAQAQAVLDEVAADDLLACDRPPRIDRLQRLSPARLANALRHWLNADHAQTPSSAQLAALMAQIGACTTRAHQIHLRIGAGFARRDGERLRWAPEETAPTG